jgi:tripartite-type tricarboxylate transporter receptor subunit TctC
MNHITRRRFVISAALAASGTISTAKAQTGGTGPIRLIVPGQAGGGASIVARVIGDKLAERWKQPIIVDNRPGAAGLLGMDLVAKSKPDGLTMLLGFAGAVTINPSLYKLPYRPIDDFAPVSLVGTEPFLMVVNPTLPVHNLKEFLAYARARPGKLTFSSSGNGSSSHLAAEYFMSLTHIKMRHIPYRGSVQAMMDVIGGQVDVHFPALSSSAPQVKAGKLRALGVASPKRSSVLPDVPTIEEAGLPNFTVDNWYGIFYPAGVSAALVERANRDIRVLVTTPQIRAQFTAQGIEPVSDTPAEFRQLIISDIAKWAKVVKSSGMTID